MPPKKKKGDEPERMPLLGRATNNVGIGIVGLPNVGKSTFSIRCLNYMYQQKIIHFVQRNQIWQRFQYQINASINFAKLSNQKVKLHLY